MGVMVHSGVLTEEKKLTQHAKEKFIQDVLDVIKYGSEDLPVKPMFQCGEPIKPNPNQNVLPDLFDEKIYSDFHKNTLGLYEKIAVALDLESNFSLLPVAADPIAIAGKFGVELPALKFPDGFIPYATGMLVPKLSADLVAAGKTEFILPIKLAQKLPSLLGVPTPPKFDPPQLTLPPPLFNVPTLPNVDLPNSQQPQLEIPGNNLGVPKPPTIPKPPNEVLSDLFSVNLSVAESIPKLVGDLIAKIPEIASKLPDIMAVAGDICKLIRDSGAFGKTEPTSTIQHAANLVLARKTAECVLGGVIATTLGSSPGSMAPTIVSNVSGEKPGPAPRDGHIPQPKPEETKAIKEDPVKWIIQTANGLKGTSFSDQQTRTQYLNGLFYAERIMSLVNPTTRRNVYGDYATDQKSTLDQAGLGNVPTLVGQNKDTVKKIPIENPTAFYQRACSDAFNQSSCAMFLRACYASSTIPNDFFLRQYEAGSAIGIFLNIAVMRNYWWTEEKATAHHKKPLLDYFYNNNKKIDTEEDPNSPYNHFIGTRTEGIQTVPNVSIDQLGFNANGKVLYVGNKKLESALEASKKDLKDLAVIEGNTLSQLTKDKGKNFPALEPGDALLLKRWNAGNNTIEPQTEHVLLVTNNRKEGWKNVTYASSGNKDKDANDPKRADLTQPIIAIEGGALDGGNRPIFDQEKKFNDLVKLLKDKIGKPPVPGDINNDLANKAQWAAILEEGKEISRAARREDEIRNAQESSQETQSIQTYSTKSLEQIQAEQIANVSKQEIENQKAKLKPRATAILQATYDRGGIVQGPKPDQQYFSIGQSLVVDSLGGAHVGGDSKQKQGPGNQYVITAIYKAKNYISEIPYLMETPEGSDDAYVASIIMDDHPEISLLTEDRESTLVFGVQYFAFPKLYDNLSKDRLNQAKEQKVIAAISTPP